MRQRRRELLDHLDGHLVKASHASGGSAGNSMIATAQFGGPTFMSCKVANDSDGDIYIADLEAAGVDHCLKGNRATGTTGKCLVLITPDAERSMNTFLGISETLSTEQLDAQAIAASRIRVYRGLSGHVPNRSGRRDQGPRNRRGGGRENRPEFFRSRHGGVFSRRHGRRSSAQRLDLIFCNEDEALGWAQSDNMDVAVEKLKADRQDLRDHPRRGGRADV